MIAKNIKDKSFGGCIRYVMNETCELLEAEGVLADSAESIIRSFAMQRSMRSEIAKPVGHIPISFAPEEKPRMTNEFILQLAKEYMQEMGIGNTQYIVVRHHNTDNDHLHIVYNRIGNDLKLISVNNDYKRNVEVCKKLKDRHGLTYGVGKERVKREKLNHHDKAKYEIYDAVTKVLPFCKNENDLRNLLEKSGIKTEFKTSRTIGEVQGISFSYRNISFKGSQVDRKFSFGNLKKEFDKNLELYNKKLKDFDIRRFLLDDLPKKPRRDEPEAVQPSVMEPPEQSVPGTFIPQELSAQTPPVKGKYVVNGVELTYEQTRILHGGGHIFLENMTQKDGTGKISAFVFLCDEKKKIFYSYDDPDKFVKYGKWEMRVRDKQLIEAGHITRAKIKYWGGDFAQPYLWKPGIVDEESTGIKVISELVSGNEYRGAWGDPQEKTVWKMEPPTTNIADAAHQTSHPTLKTAADTAQTTAPPASSVGQVVSDMGKSIGGTSADSGSSFGSTIVDTVSFLGGIFDIQPSPCNDQQNEFLKKKPKKKKKRGWGQGM